MFGFLFSKSKPKNDFKSILKSWNLAQYIKKFENEGYDDMETWDSLIEDDGASLINDIGMKKGHSIKFIKSYKQKFGNNNDDEKKEPIKVKLNNPMGKVFVNPKTNKTERGFYVLKATKATSDPYSKYYQNFINKGQIASASNRKVILVVGQTGAGKSTVLNSMINYIYGLHFEDKFRYKLIVEPPKKDGQAESQTDHVTSYELPDKNSILGYRLTVVDTPGFGDTRGVDKDISIMKDIKLWFERKLDTLDAVCFVVKATDGRLTHTQKYIFSSIQSLFGKDIKKNIFILVTFADTSDPPALAALKKEGIEYTKFYKLNNSVFFKDPLKSNAESAVFDKMYWDMGIKCFKLFFDDLRKTRPVSLKLSRQVLREREIIGIKIETLRQNLDVGLEQVIELEKQKAWIKRNEEAINANAEEPYEEKRLTWIKKHTGNNLITTCITCPNQTCHPNCGVSQKAHCWAMTDGQCRICKCPDWNHENRDYVWKQEFVIVTITNWDLIPSKKKDYEEATKNQTRAQRILAGRNANLKAVEDEVKRCIIRISEAIQELSKIALDTKVLTAKDYFDKVIEMETKNKKEGWVQRIESLKRLSDEAEIISKIKDNKFDFRETVGWTDETPGANQPGTDEAKADEAKTDEPIADEPIADEPIADEAKADEAKADEAKADEPIADEAKADEAKADEAKTDEAKTDEAKTDEAKTDEAIADEPIADEPIADEAKADEAIADEPQVIQQIEGEQATT